MNIAVSIFAECSNKPSELALCAPGTECNLASYARLRRSVDNVCGRINPVGIVPRGRVGIVVKDRNFHAHLF
jgi:hypothetical protein